MILPFLPSAIESFDLEAYDLIVSSSSCVAKGALKATRAKHVCYIHSPMRYVWDERESYLSRLPGGGNLLVRAVFHMLASRLRIWDVCSSARVDCFVANSSFVATRIKAFYNRDSRVVFPPVDVERFASPAFVQREDYWLIVGAHTAYKRHDFVTEYFAQSDQKLVVVGNGPELSHLRRIAGPNTRFLVDPSSEELRTLYAKAKGLIFPGREDFGIVPVEAMLTGCPVLAYKQGGALDTVKESLSGMFFSNYDKVDFGKLLQAFTQKPWDHNAIQQHAKQFSKDRFKQGILDAVVSTGIPLESLAQSLEGSAK